MLKRILRVLAGQAVAMAPDIINWLAGTALPSLPAPWGAVAGAVLNGLGKWARDTKGWTWTPV